MGCSGFREIPIRISIGSSSYGLRAAISPQVPFTMSVLQMLTKACPAQAVADRSVSSVGGDVRAWVASVDDYIAKIKEDIDSKRVSIQGQPLITSSHVMGMARNMEKEMKDQDLQPPTVAEALSLASRPDVYIWAPDKIFPGLSIKCPACSGAVKSREWTKARILHGIATQMVYITVKYRCRACACRIGPQAAATTKVKQRIFQADSPTVLATFPRYVQATWQFYDSGKIICEASVVVTGGDAMQGGRVFSRVGVGRWTTHPQGGQVSRTNSLGCIQARVFSTKNSLNRKNSLGYIQGRVFSTKRARGQDRRVFSSKWLPKGSPDTRRPKVAKT